jgi:proline iminopeptidase
MPIMLVNNKKMYYETYGDKSNPTLLFLHGGPGSSCVDFSLCQAELLSAKLYVIIFDQRGVMRSDAIKKDEDFNIKDIIYDCEEMRKQLGIQAWSILGHSFGGMLALIYARMFPNNIEKIIYENPTFSVYHSFKSHLQKLSLYFKKINDDISYNYCIDKIDTCITAEDLSQAFFNLPNGLSEDAQSYLFYNTISISKAREKYYTSEHAKTLMQSITQEMNDRCQTFSNRVLQDKTFYQNHLTLLDNIKIPSALFVGKFDSVCDKTQRVYFENHVPLGKIVAFSNSSHFIMVDEPEEYTKQVFEFIL